METAIKNEISIVSNKDNTSVALARNGKLLICPLRQPIVTQEIEEKKTIDISGTSEPKLITKTQMQICSSECAMFKMNMKGTKLEIELCCSKGNIHSFDIKTKKD